MGLLELSEFMPFVEFKALAEFAFLNLAKLAAFAEFLFVEFLLVEFAVPFKFEFVEFAPAEFSEFTEVEFRPLDFLAFLDFFCARIFAETARA